MLTVQDDKKTYIRPSILYYYKKLPACLLTNMNTQLGMVNRAQILVIGVILDSQSNAQLFDLSNFAYRYSFLYMARWQHFVELISSYMHFVTYWICINGAFPKPFVQCLSSFSCKIDSHGKRDKAQ